jgi:uncharacterized cofD-like protein
LIAEYEDGTRTQGEARIPNPQSRIKNLYLTPENARPTQDSLTAVDEADVIILGPGSLYTSVIPNLLIKEMSQAIAKSNAFKIYVCNVMTQKGETDHYSASEHLKALIQHSNKNIVDSCLINNAIVPEEALVRYKAEQSFPVKADVDKIKEMGYAVVATDLLGVTDYVRHDAHKLNAALIRLISTNRVIKR